MQAARTVTLTGLMMLAPALVAWVLSPRVTPVICAGFVLAATTPLIHLLSTEHRRRRAAAHAATDLRDTLGHYTPTSDDATARMRTISVMFVDIRGFTAWSEQASPDDLFTELELLLGELADCVTSTDGTIDKFTGDGLMALWNAPDDQADHADRAVRAIPQMLMRLHEFNLRRTSTRHAPLKVGIGVATGPAVVGTIGHRRRRTYTAIGDTVNLAARLEHATRDANTPVLIDEGTFLALDPALQRQMQRLDSIEVGGRSKRVRPFTPAQLVTSSAFSMRTGEAG